MPHATFRYRFEWKLLEAATAFGAERQGSAARGHGYALIADAQGKSLAYFPESDASDFRERYDSAPHALLYDPFDAPEYTYLAWKGLDQAALRSLLGLQLESSDLGTMEGSERLVAFPSTHGVMF
jgi:hypothetical protein